jgi:hypothetical protein
MRKLSHDVELAIITAWIMGMETVMEVHFQIHLRTTLSCSRHEYQDFL